MISKIEILLIFICICELLQVIRMFVVWRNEEKEAKMIEIALTKMDKEQEKQDKENKK